MRLWSIHPKYLDSKGLVALWREALLAKHVLEGKTKGYKNHPQLIRFRNTDKPVDSINRYLSEVYREAAERGYSFDRNKIDWQYEDCVLSVTSGQMNFEIKHLLNKLKKRDYQRYLESIKNLEFIPHPIFNVISGEIEVWEITSGNMHTNS